MKIRTDHLLHFETCALIAVIAGLVLPWWAAGTVALVVGIGKEVWDSRHDGAATWADVFWDAIGAIAGTIITIL